MTTTNNKIDFAIITAMPEELEAVLLSKLGLLPGDAEPLGKMGMEVTGYGLRAGELRALE
jgi:hypothetical protein